MIHLKKISKIISKGISKVRQITHIELGRHKRKAQNSRIFTQCDSLLMGKGVVLTQPYIKQKFIFYYRT